VLAVFGDAAYIADPAGLNIALERTALYAVFVKPHAAKNWGEVIMVEVPL
jgi:hypothetical protein